MKNVLLTLLQEIDHWKRDRDTDPEWSDMMISELEEAVEVLTIYMES